MKLRRTKNGANFIVSIFGPPCTYAMLRLLYAVVSHLTRRDRVPLAQVRTGHSQNLPQQYYAATVMWAALRVLPVRLSVRLSSTGS